MVEDSECLTIGLYEATSDVVLTVPLDDVLFDHKWNTDDAIGLDHPDRRPNKTTAERGIVMR